MTTDSSLNAIEQYMYAVPLISFGGGGGVSVADKPRVLHSLKLVWCTPWKHIIQLLINEQLDNHCIHPTVANSIYNGYHSI